LVACSGSTGPAGTGRLTFQLSGRSSASAAPTFAAGADVLTITKVQVVARKIKLERAAGTCPADATPAGMSLSDSEGSKDGAGDKECADVRLDPMLLEPPVDATAAAVFSIDLPEGTYSEMKVQVHKPTSSSNDAAFLTAHPDMQDISVKVTGTFNGTAFAFTSAITAEVEIELETPVQVVAGTPAAITLQVDLSKWFTAGSGLLNPVSPTQQIRSQIEQNIRASFHAFKDHDHDGHADSD
jgi:hypothetical protein